MNHFLKRTTSLALALTVLSSPLWAGKDEDGERRDPLPSAKKQRKHNSTINWEKLGYTWAFKEDYPFPVFWNTLTSPAKSALSKKIKKDPVENTPIRSVAEIYVEAKENFYKNVDFSPYAHILKALQKVPHMAKEGYHFYLMENYEEEYNTLRQEFNTQALNKILKLKLASMPSAAAENPEESGSEAILLNHADMPNNEDMVPPAGSPTQAPEKTTLRRTVREQRPVYSINAIENKKIIRWKDTELGKLAQEHSKFESFWEALEKSTDKTAEKVYRSYKQQEIKKSFKQLKTNIKKREKTTNSEYIHWEKDYAKIIERLLTLNVRTPIERTQYIEQNDPEIYQELLKKSGGNRECLTNKLNMLFVNKKNKDLN